MVGGVTGAGEVGFGCISFRSCATCGESGPTGTRLVWRALFRVQVPVQRAELCDKSERHSRQTAKHTRASCAPSEWGLRLAVRAGYWARPAAGLVAILRWTAEQTSLLGECRLRYQLLAL